MGLDLGAAVLIEQYKLLKNKLLEEAAHPAADDGASSAAVGAAVDAIYARIVASPIVDLVTAAEKLRFAQHCLTDEEDSKEAANLVLQVCYALEQLPMPTDTNDQAWGLRAQTADIPVAQICRNAAAAGKRPMALCAARRGGVSDLGTVASGPDGGSAARG